MTTAQKLWAAVLRGFMLLKNEASLNMCAKPVKTTSETLFPTSDTTPTWSDLNFWRTTLWKKIKKMVASHPQYITPNPNRIFRPLFETPLSKVKVVMLFPEPYYSDGVADGLALSHNRPDGKNPYLFEQFMEELKRSLDVTSKRSDLKAWARRGVLLWNARPTTLIGHALGHKGLGWEALTKEILETVYLVNPKAVFCFYGPEMFEEYRRQLPPDATCLEIPKVEIGRKNILGSRLFVHINLLLKKGGQTRINWSV